MKKFSTLMIAALGAATVAYFALPAEAQVTSSGNGYLLRLKFVKGTKAIYKVSTSNPMTGKPVSTTVSQVVKAVKGTSAQVEISATPPPGSTSKAPQKTTMTIDHRGRITNGPAQMGSQFGNIELPEKPVRVGQTWSQQIEAMPGMKVNSTYKLLGTKSVGNIPCLNVGVTMKGGNAQINFSGTGNTLMRMGDGSAQSLNMNVKVTISMPDKDGKAKRQTFNQNVSMVRS